MSQTVIPVALGYYRHIIAYSPSFMMYHDVPYYAIRKVSIPYRPNFVTLQILVISPFCEEEKYWMCVNREDLREICD